MRQGCVRPIGRDGFETVAAVAFDLGAERVQLLRRIPFRHMGAVLHLGLEPAEETLHRHAVLDEGTTEPFEFLLVLDGLAQDHRRRAEDDVVAEHLAEHLVRMPVERGRIGVEPAAFVPVGFQGVFQHCIIGVRHFLDRRHVDDVAHEPDGLFLGHEEAGDDIRIVIDVLAADIQQPGDLVECSQEDGITSRLLHDTAQPGELFLAGLPHALLIEPGNGTVRDGRAVLPERIEKIGAILNRISTCAIGFPQGSIEFVDGSDALAETVDGDTLLPLLIRRKMAGQPLGNWHFLGNAGLVEFDARTGKLPVGLDEIAAVRPEAGVVLRDDQVTGFAGKPAHPFDLFPPRCGIFAAMGIRPRNDDGVISEPPDLIDALCKNVAICHIMQI